MALLTRDACRHQLGVGSVNAHTDCGGVVINCFKQSLGKCQYFTAILSKLSDSKPMNGINITPMGIMLVIVSFIGTEL